jgi:dTDP-4-dehydrorhamnose 3,5-epimerase
MSDLLPSFLLASAILRQFPDQTRAVRPHRLSAENKKQFFIPKNFAHGFIVLSDHAEFCYKCTDFYHPNDEGGLLWSDPEIGVEWPMPEGMTVEDLTFSEKDTKWSGIKEYKK